MNPKGKGRVMIGMSGGVDSSVTAALLKAEGYDCVGVYMNLWADPTLFDLKDKQKFPQNKCCSIESLMFARQICQKLDMPFYSVNFEEQFKKNVVDFFLDGFKEGETPNPCVRCNKTIKFGLFFEKMKELGCDYLATGHYAQLKTEEEGRVSLHLGLDQTKDQSYFLYNLTQTELKQLKFPLGGYTKSEVKALAKKYELKELENKKESQGVCFYPEKTYFGFLERYLEPEKDYEEGEIINTENKVLGTHKGLPFYTVGQRKGIGIGGGPALYVNKLDKINNAIIVGSEEELESSEVDLREVNFISGLAPDESLTYQFRIRSHGTFVSGQLKKIETGYHISFDSPQNSVMAGQSLVIYKDNELIGGGIMTN
ncbi:MAG: tRNA-specific 2-thiouridylase [Oceanicoccus sp.]|jgi:tRNA-specific 2-thiouridylase